MLRTRPYRLDADVDTDFGAVRRALRSGQPGEALRACAGPLLPRSDAPEIRELRDELDGGPAPRRPRLRRRRAAAAFAEHPLGRDDVEVHDRLVALLAPNDPRRPGVVSRHTRLLADG